MEFKDLPAARFTKIDEFIKTWMADVLRQYDNAGGTEVPMSVSEAKPTTLDMVNELHANFNLAISHARNMMDTVSLVNKLCQSVPGDTVEVLEFKLTLSTLIRARIEKL